MKTLPNVENSYKALHDLVTAPIRSRLLMTGIELGFFDEMAEFRSAVDIAAAVGTHAGNTERFLNGLTTIGLVEKKDGLYRNGPEAAAYLMKNAPAYLGPLFQIIQRMCVDPLEGLRDLVKNGPCPQTREEAFSSEEHWAAATRATAGWVAGGVGQTIASILSSQPEFAGFRKMLDLGGGTECSPSISSTLILP